MRESLIRLLKDKLCRKDNNCGYCQYHTGNMCEIDKLADAILKDNWVKLPCDLGGGGIRSRSAVRWMSCVRGSADG